MVQQVSTNHIQGNKIGPPKGFRIFRSPFDPSHSGGDSPFSTDVKSPPIPFVSLVIVWNPDDWVQKGEAAPTKKRGMSWPLGKQASSSIYIICTSHDSIPEDGGPKHLERRFPGWVRSRQKKVDPRIFGCWFLVLPFEVFLS